MLIHVTTDSSGARYLSFFKSHFQPHIFTEIVQFLDIMSIQLKILNEIKMNK
jgi:hypothetical protein